MTCEDASTQVMIRALRDGARIHRARELVHPRRNGSGESKQNEHGEDVDDEGHEESVRPGKRNDAAHKKRHVLDQEKKSQGQAKGRDGISGSGGPMFAAARYGRVS